MLRLCNTIFVSTLLLCLASDQPTYPQGPTKTLPGARPGGIPRGDGRDGDEWIKVPPDGMRLDDAPDEVKETDIYEIVTSHKSVAIHELRDRLFVPLTPSEAQAYTGHYFKCPEGKTPFLVRAVFGHGGTGKYVVKRFGPKLLVFHGSLGRTPAANKSALIINLDFIPKDIFTYISIVE